MLRLVSRLIFCTTLFPLISIQMAGQDKFRDPSHVLAITHVTVIDGTGAPPKLDKTVVIVGDRIAQLGDSGSVRVPKEAKVIDGTSKFLIPGLWDMHVHLDYKDYLPLFIANGVTGVRVMWGSPQHQEWRRAIGAGSLLGPRMKIGSALIDGPYPYWSGSISVKNEAEARHAVAEAKNNGADFVKVYQFLPRDLYLDIADEAKKEGIPFEGHLPVTVTAEEGSRAGQKSFEHMVGVLPASSTRQEVLFRAAQADFAELAHTHPRFEGLHETQLGDEMLSTYSPEKAATLSAVFRNNGTWQCPTLVLLRMFAYGNNPAFLRDSRLRYMPPRMRDRWDPSQLEGSRTPQDFAYSGREFQIYLKAVNALNNGGTGILAGTDSQNPYVFYGFSLHDELGLLVEAGLSPMQALQTATLNPARFFGMEKDLGTVEEGKLADLVVLDANPLDTINNTRRINAVIYGGKLYPRASLDEMLATVEYLAARPLIGSVLLKTIQEKGVDAAVKQYRELKAQQPDGFDFSERELIGCGYQLIHLKKYKEAIEIFKLSVEAYPQSYNTYDSLAEAYMDNGDNELAIANYQRSLQLNPANTNAVQMMKKMNPQ